MTHLLHISASPRGAASQSLALAQQFLASAREARPGLHVEEFDLWDGNLPEFGPAAARAVTAVDAGRAPAREDACAWAAAKATFERYNAADEYLFSVPMWNAGIPYILKQFIDVVSQPGMVFTFDAARGYTGLLSEKKAAVIYTSSAYGPGRPPGFGQDFQLSYMEDWLRWTGITDITSVEFRPNFDTDDDDDAGRRRAHAAARDAGRTF